MFTLHFFFIRQEQMKILYMVTGFNDYSFDVLIYYLFDYLISASVTLYRLTDILLRTVNKISPF